MSDARHVTSSCVSERNGRRTSVIVDTAFVGLSFKEGMEALDSRTTSGALIDEILRGLSGVGSWRTNLVDKVLLDHKGKPRNPTLGDVSRCFKKFEQSIRRRQPRVVIALGALTSRQILGKMAGTEFSGWAGSLEYEPVVCGKTAYIAAHHPSHIAVYRRRDRDNYVRSLRNAIERVLMSADSQEMC